MVKQLKQRVNYAIRKSKKNKRLDHFKNCPTLCFAFTEGDFFENFKALIKDFQVLKSLIRKELFTNFTRMTKNNL